jgi:hypothetical protein
MIDKEDFEIEPFPDGALSLSCGSLGASTDLVFAEGAMRGDPLLEHQREILEFIVDAIRRMK